jgi:cytochrome c553
VAAQPAVPGKAQACVACHGPAGNSPTTIVPSLAGQPKQFLVTQLFLFREGNRKDQQMTPIAATLSNADMNELAAYFTAQKSERKGAPLTAERLQAAQQLASSNHCNSCHGPQLLGQQHIPRLAGQHADYLKIQLRGFKASTRFDMDGQMTSAAQALSAADIELLAEYLAGLGPQ